jgi:hypothetical protein
MTGLQLSSTLSTPGYQIRFLMIVTGFTIQYFALPQPKSIVELRKDIKLLKMREKRLLI